MQTNINLDQDIRVRFTKHLKKQGIANFEHLPVTVQLTLLDPFIEEQRRREAPLLRVVNG